jgi:hypothetical protein
MIFPLGVERLSFNVIDTVVTEIFHHGRWGGVMCITFSSSGKSFIIEIPYYGSFTRTINDNGGDTQTSYYVVIERRTAASEDLYFTTNVSARAVFIPSAV